MSRFVYPTMQNDLQEIEPRSHQPFNQVFGIKRSSSLLRRICKKLNWIEPSINKSTIVPTRLHTEKHAESQSAHMQASPVPPSLPSQPNPNSSHELPSRPNNRFSMLSMLSGKTSDSQSSSIINSNIVKINLERINSDSIYRPGDTVRGSIALHGSDVEGRSLRGVNVKIVGKATFSRYDVEANSASGMLQRVVVTRTTSFLSTQDKLSLPSRRNHSDSGVDYNFDDEEHNLPFALRLPDYDAASALIETTPDRSMQRRRFAPLPPTCKIEKPEPQPLNKRSSGSNYAPATKLINLMRSSSKDLIVEIRYYIVADVQWQRSLLHSNRLSAKIDLVVHPSPPATTAVQFGVELAGNNTCRSRVVPDLSLQYQLAGFRNHPEHQPSLASPIRPSVDTVLSRRPVSESYPSNFFNTHQMTSSSQAPRRQTLDMTSRPRMLDSLTRNKLNSREVAVISSNHGPRGWYIQRCTRTLADGTDLLFELQFFYPATPCFFMDEDIPFKLDITCAASTFDEGIAVSKVQSTSVRFKLLRHVHVTNACGKLQLEKGNAMEGGRGSSSTLIQIIELKKKDTTPAPQDEYSGATFDRDSCEQLSGKFRIESGWKEAQAALEEASRVTMSAAAYHKEVSIDNLGATLVTPSFVYKGVSIEYTIGIEVKFSGCNSESEDSSNHCDQEQESFTTIQVETGPIRLNSRPPPSSTTVDAADTQEEYNRIGERLSRSSTLSHSTSRCSTPNRSLSMTMPVVAPSRIRRVPVPPLLNGWTVNAVQGSSASMSQVPDTDTPAKESSSIEATTPDQEIQDHSNDYQQSPHHPKQDEELGEEEAVFAHLNVSPEAAASSQFLQTSRSTFPVPEEDEEGEQQDDDEELNQVDSSSARLIDEFPFPDSNNTSSMGSSRARSATIQSTFSHFSAQTLDGLPPPYSS